MLELEVLMDIAMTRFVRRPPLSIEAVNVFPLFYEKAFSDFTVLPVVIQLCSNKRWCSISISAQGGT